MELRLVRVGPVLLAAAGLVGCLAVAAFTWQDWQGAPRALSVALDLGLAAAGTALAFSLAWAGKTWLAFPVALLVLVWGWFGTWAYVFLWVPGAAALLACLLPGSAVRPATAG